MVRTAGRDFRAKLIEAVDAMLPDPERVLSKHHCLIELRGELWYLTDTSSNGVFLGDSSSAIGQGGSEMVNVGRLREDLKKDPDFAAAVKDIQIESVKRVQEKEIEIVQFTLSCTLAETGVTP